MSPEQDSLGMYRWELRAAAAAAAAVWRVEVYFYFFKNILQQQKEKGCASEMMSCTMGGSGLWKGWNDHCVLAACWGLFLFAKGFFFYASAYITIFDPL